MDSIEAIAHRLQNYPLLAQGLSLTNLHQFIVFAARLKPDIILAQPSSYVPEVPPEYLPTSIRQALSDLTGLDVSFIPACWTFVKDLAWNDAYNADLQLNTQRAFLQRGVAHGFST